METTFTSMIVARSLFTLSITRVAAWRKWCMVSRHVVYRWRIVITKVTGPLQRGWVLLQFFFFFVCLFLKYMQSKSCVALGIFKHLFPLFLLYYFFYCNISILVVRVFLIHSPPLYLVSMRFTMTTSDVSFPLNAFERSKYLFLCFRLNISTLFFVVLPKSL